MENRKWLGPNGIEYEFVMQFGRIMTYYEHNGMWIHATREFKNFDEVHEWQQQMIEDYKKNKPEPNKIEGNPYNGTSGNYVGD